MFLLYAYSRKKFLGKPVGSSCRLRSLDERSNGKIRESKSTKFTAGSGAMIAAKIKKKKKKNSQSFPKTSPV
jgi:hypothetical protein